MKNVALHNLGCKVNSYEIDVVQQMLEENGYNIVPFDEAADIYIINTCSVTNIADRKSRQMLHKAKNKNPDAIVVAMGCYVQTAGDKIKQDECIDLAIGNNKKHELVQMLETFLASKERDKTLRNSTIIDINHTDEYEDMKLEYTAEHTRAYIKIQDGCNQFCSYCIIPFARGRVRSRSKKDIIKEVEDLCKKGYREFVFTGIHISSYGMDFYNEAYNTGQMRGEELLELIKAVAGIKGVKRIRLGSLEPCIVTRDFAQKLSQIKQVCPHFHLSLQSGCDETLKRMNRQYTTQEFADGVRALREAFDRPAITTDVITGFPMESEEEFEKTKAFLEQIEFFEMHIFPFSRRKGTVADTMKGQLTEAVKKARSHILLELEKSQSKSYRELFISEEIELLFEEEKQIDGRKYMVGHSTRYVKAAVSLENGETYDSNELYTGKAVGMLTDEILLIN